MAPNLNVILGFSSFISKPYIARILASSFSVERKPRVARVPNKGERAIAQWRVKRAPTMRHVISALAGCVPNPAYRA